MNIFSGVGGTSLINYMLYTRGYKADYDRWAELGNTGWSYDDVLPYFKKSERIGIPELRNSTFHGHNGTLDVQYSRYKTKLMKGFLKAGIELGYNITDPNGDHGIGFSRVQANIRDGRRCSAGKAFIQPAKDRRNLHISLKSWVTKILIDPETKRVQGVEFVKNKKRFSVKVKKEIVLSAGSIGSPQLLMLSGIGPKEDLEKLNITVLQDLKVGYNLQDHVTLNGLTFLVNESLTLNDAKLLNFQQIFEYVAQRRGPYTLPGKQDIYERMNRELIINL